MQQNLIWIRNKHQYTKVADLANLKPDADRLDIDKLETTPANFSNLNNVVKIDVVKKTVYDGLV